MNKPDDFDCWRLPDDDSVKKCAHLALLCSPSCAAAFIGRAGTRPFRLARLRLLSHPSLSSSSSSLPRVTITPDTKVPNAATLVIEREDHTLGNILRMQLLEDKEVSFSGYRVQHPLEPAIQVKVQTKSDNPGPVKAVEDALGHLLKELGSIEKAFRHELDKKASAEPAAGGPGGPGMGYSAMDIS
jgi:DNA-directed RNA polymerase II subunit RPB11